MPDLTDQEWAERAIGRWVDAAAEGLCAEARTQIHNETRAKFSDAIIALITTGADEGAALLAAEKALGDPRAVRRALQRLHLTEDEAVRVRRVTRPPSPARKVWHWSLGLICFMVLASMISMTASLDPLKAPHAMAFILMLTGLGLVQAALPVAWRFARRVPVNALVLLTFATDIILALWMIGVHGKSVLRAEHLPFARTLLGLFSFGLAFELFQYLSLWLKLRRHPEAAREPVPPKSIGA